MRSKTVLFYMLSFVLLCFPACKAEKVDGTPAGNALAKVNGVAITEDDRYLFLEGGHGGAVTPEKRAQSLEDLINQELLYQKGLKMGLDKDAKYQNAVRVMEVRLQAFKRAEMARRVASTQIASMVNVTDEDVNQYIDVNAERLKTEFHLGMIRFSGESEAQEVLMRLQNGETFENEARRKYLHVPKTDKAPWDLGYLRWHQIPVRWQEAVERLGKGEVSTVLQEKRTGFSIIKLIDRRMNPKADLSSMRAGITNRLRDEKITQAYEAYINSLRNEAKIILQEERRTSLE